MKRIMCAVLSLVMLLGLVSCTTGGTQNTEKADPFALFDDGTVPTAITTTVSYNYTDASNSENDISLTGYYRTVTEWDRSIFTYEYECLATIEEQSEGNIKTIKGTIYKDGDNVSTDGDTFEDGKALPGVSISINLVKESFDSYTVSEDGKSFVAKATGENIKKALGVALAANADGVNISVTGNGRLITGLVVSYTTANGAEVLISTSYTYAPVSFDWPEQENG